MTYINKKGTVSLETAISLSIVLIFITGIICVTVFLRTDILMQRSVEQSCEDFAMIMPCSVTASDTVSTLVNALPDNASGNSDIERIGSAVAGIDTITSGSVRAALLTIIMGERFTDDIASQYVDYNGGSNFWGPEQICVDLDIEDYYIDVNVTYCINTIIGPIQRQIISVIPFYGDFELFLSADDGESQPSDDIWHEDNFTRGRYFAQMYGANLPPTFPVINSYNSGNVTSIVSIDLNRPTYATAAACLLKVSGQIDQLAGFNGARVNNSGSSYDIPGESITSRTLIVVIPEDSPGSSAAALDTMYAYAAARGVLLQIERYGISG